MIPIENWFIGKTRAVHACRCMYRHVRTHTYTHTQHTPLLNGILHAAEGGIHHIENGRVVLIIKLLHFSQDSFLCQKNRVIHFITKGTVKSHTLSKLAINSLLFSVWRGMVHE